MALLSRRQRASDVAIRVPIDWAWGRCGDVLALAGLIDAHRDRFGVEPACAVLGFPVSSYYFASKREGEPTARDARDAELKEKIMDVRKGERGREIYGRGKCGWS
jgi:hypothetical protein